MVNNLMQQYIRNTKEFLKKFTKIFFAEDYNENISNEYIDSYIEARVYNYYEEEHRFFYTRIYEVLSNKKSELEKQCEKEEKEIVEKNLKMYQLVFYIDGVRSVDNIEEFAKIICEKRIKEFELQPIRGIENKIKKLIKDYNEEKEEFMKGIDSKDFSLNIEKYTLIDNTYKVKLDYIFKLPYIYSDEVIDEVYNEGTINEDKLIIEYTLLVEVCIRDINNGDFETKYLVDFAKTLFKKEKKIKQTLKILDDLAIQDKIILKIEYCDFEENKDIIYDLIQYGFKFAVIIDDTFEVKETNIRKLNIFKYMLVPKTSKSYEAIKDRESRISNIIIYDV